MIVLKYTKTHENCPKGCKGISYLNDDQEHKDCTQCYVKWNRLTNKVVNNKMGNQIEIVKDIAEGMVGIGGIPNNKEFYAEFNSRVAAKLGIKTECKWKHVDVGMYGCNDYVYQTSCNTEFDATKTDRSKFCPNCGNTVV